MASQPHSPKPSTPPPAPKPEAAKRHEPPPIGAKPDDPKDPQAQKFDPQPGPPHWGERREPLPLQPDGMTVADEQRKRSEEIEKMGGHYPPDERTGEEQKQVPGVTPPTKRE